MKHVSHALAGLIILLFFGMVPAYAANPNLFVSAENPQFENHFAGSMVVEVVIRDSAVNNLGSAQGEPSVTLNSKDLRMVQAGDGNWYAYFANLEKARIADGISFEGGVAGQGLDFGVFCDRSTADSVFGVGFSDADGIAVASSNGILGFTNGEQPFSPCTGSLAGYDSVNNVVRKAKSVNTNVNVPSGQIGLDPNAWPIIQLFSFNDVTITYHSPGSFQTANLKYDEIPNIAIDLDRDLYPASSEVFARLSDVQLNQDPTDRDSWTFGTGSNPATFYQAFTSTGANSANGGAGLKNLVPHLDRLGFDNNGIFDVSLDFIASLGTNNNQPYSSVSDGIATFDNIVTFVETGRHSGIFESSDHDNNSIIGLVDNAGRGLVDSVTYNGDSLHIISGHSTASIHARDDPATSMSNPNTWRPGTSIPVSIHDPDQNLNSGIRDKLDLYRSTAIIPTITINDPITLAYSSDVTVYGSSASSGVSVPSHVPDSRSARLLLDTRQVSSMDFEKISINLGKSAAQLGKILIDNRDDFGTNWINYDFRSLQRQLELDDVTDTSIALHFGDAADNEPVVIADSGDLSKLQDLMQIDDDDVASISSKSGAAYLVINFDDSDDSAFAGMISDESDKQPIVFDIFSFGIKNGKSTSNSIYRFELVESSRDSGIFTGTLEYAITNQLNIVTADLIETLRTIDDQVKFVVTDRLLDEDGISISFSDVSDTGHTVPSTFKSSIITHSGTVSTDASSYGFGRPVTIILNDPDLNLDNDRIDVYTVINDPLSDHVDTVGGIDGTRLLEVKIKGIKYQRCIVHGAQHGGLGATGFTLSETSPASGVFKGTFKMPSQICNKDGTRLVYTSGGSIDVRYFDFRNSSGEKDVITLSRQTPRPPHHVAPHLNSQTFTVPQYSKTTDVILTGTVGNPQRDSMVDVVLSGPDALKDIFAVHITDLGKYRAILTLNSDSPVGRYNIDAYYQDVKIPGTYFDLLSNGQDVSGILESLQNNTKAWSEERVSDDVFLDGVMYLAKQKIIAAPQDQQQSYMVPNWIRDISKWWIQGIVSDNEYVDALDFLVKKGIIRI